MKQLKQKRLSASLEDYLEAILVLVDENQVARVRDIAERLGVSMSSVTGQLKNLAERGLVNYAPYQVVTLTDSGRRRAEDVARRHEILSRFMIEILGVEPGVARRNACRMEHAVEPEILERLIRFVDFIQSSPEGAAEYVPGVGYQSRGEDPSGDGQALRGGQTSGVGEPTRMVEDIGE